MTSAWQAPPPFVLLQLSCSHLDAFSLVQLSRVNQSYHSTLTSDGDAALLWSHLPLLTLSHQHSSRDQSITCSIRQAIAETSMNFRSHLHGREEEYVTRCFSVSMPAEAVVPSILRHVPRLCFLYCRSFRSGQCPTLSAAVRATSSLKALAIGRMPVLPHRYVVSHGLMQTGEHVEADRTDQIKDIAEALADTCGGDGALRWSAAVHSPGEHQAVYGRPSTSQIRQLILDVTFPALTSRALPDPSESRHAALQNTHMAAIWDAITRNCWLCSLSLLGHFSRLWDSSHPLRGLHAGENTADEQEVDFTPSTPAPHISALHITTDDRALRELCGDPVFSSLTALNLGLKHAPADSSCALLVPGSIECLASLPRLKHLRTAIMYPCDEFLFNIGRLTGLQSLHISWSLDDGWPSQQDSLFLRELINLQELALMGHDGALYDNEDCLSITTIATFFPRLKHLDISQLAGSGSYRRFLVELVELATSGSAVARSAVSTASGPLFPSLERLFLSGIGSSPHPDEDLNEFIVRWLDAIIAETCSDQREGCVRQVDSFVLAPLCPRLRMLVLEEMYSEVVMNSMAAGTRDTVRRLCNVQGSPAAAVVALWRSLFPFTVVLDSPSDHNAIVRLKEDCQLFALHCAQLGILSWPSEPQ